MQTLLLAEWYHQQMPIICKFFFFLNSVLVDHLIFYDVMRSITLLIAFCTLWWHRRGIWLDMNLVYNFLFSRNFKHKACYQTGIIPIGLIKAHSFWISYDVKYYMRASSWPYIYPQANLLRLGLAGQYIQ